MTPRLLLPLCLALLSWRAVRAQTAPPRLLSGEAANAPAEEALFPGLSSVRQTAPDFARTGQAAFRLRAQSLPSVLLPVEAGQQLTLTVYARTAPARRWLGPVARLVAGGLVVGARPAPGPPPRSSPR